MVLFLYTFKIHHFFKVRFHVNQPASFRRYFLKYQFPFRTNKKFQMHGLSLRGEFKY